MLGCGYFLHTCAPNITRTAMYPERNKFNLICGYTLVLMTYIVVGIMGYIGFIGAGFTYYYQNQDKDASDFGVINQNCLNMFKYDNIPAWFLRLAIFCCLFSTYPLINHFTKTILKNLIWKGKEVARSKEVVLNVALSIIPLLFALFYPNVGVITTYIGAVAGFLLIYLLPVLVHLKRMRLRIMEPVLAAALEQNAVRVEVTADKSPQMVVRDRFLERNKDSILGKTQSWDERLQKQKEAMKRYYVQVVLHSFIPIFGFMILVSVCIPTG